MDEPAQCCCIDYAAAENIVQCWQLYVGRALVTAKFLNFGVERNKNVCGERISNKYFNQILQRNSPYVPMVLKRKIWWMPANPDTKKIVSGSKLCRPNRGILAKSADIWLSGRHVANMSATFSAKPTTPTPRRITTRVGRHRGRIRTALRRSMSNASASR